ncbi:hypothetical protein [Bacillus sp. XF8]|uniref:hypothetical protein n=1 Tax=Bacillus sp. XF8 TaxID=2819289 RepID=UPI001AA01C1D|nr:hypothetical protein [Bacillus sp. XF8]MBO1581586.1 hypothetical protein [Bacillus sp. XF8]
MTTHTEALQSTYDKAITLVAEEDTSLCDEFSDEEISILNKIIEFSEKAKGVLTVIVTSLTHKIVHPEQDIRYHQDNLPNGYSGRGIDTRFITPFMKSANFPAMSESGWLTRSLEQNAPYLLEYRGSIRPLELKTAFLSILNNVEENGADADKYLLYIFNQLIIERDKKNIELAKPSSLTIENIANYLETHFNFRYHSRGASRLPVLAIYSAYQCMMKEVKRFEGKTLMPLESHTSADSQSGSVGDLEIRDEKGRVFEGAEIKHGHKVTAQMVRDAFEKFKIHPIQRYYILSTVGHKEDEYEEIQQEIQRIRSLHGCQIIVNGLNSSIKYYLRLLDDTFEFVNYYVENLKVDGALKFEHKEKWNDIVSGR